MGHRNCNRYEWELAKFRWLPCPNLWYDNTGISPSILHRTTFIFFPSRPNGPYRSVRESEPKCWYLLGNWRSQIFRTLIWSKGNEQWWRLLMAVLPSILFLLTNRTHFYLDNMVSDYKPARASECFWFYVKWLSSYVMKKKEGYFQKFSSKVKFSFSSGIKITFNIAPKHFHL